MIKSEKTIVINRPIEEVFAFMGNLENGPQWQPGLLEVRRVSDGPLGIGTKFSFVRQFMGRKMEAISECIYYKLNSELAFKSSTGPMAFTFSWLFEPTAEGTQLTALIKMQPKGFMGLAEPLIAANVGRDMETQFGDLKNLIESRVTAASS